MTRCRADLQEGHLHAAWLPEGGFPASPVRAWTTLRGSCRCPSAYCPCAVTRLLALLTALVVVLGVAGCGLSAATGRRRPRRRSRRRGRAATIAAAAALTDDPAAATELLTAVRESLAPAEPGRCRSGRCAPRRTRRRPRWTCGGTSGRAASGATSARSACAAPGAVTAPRGRSPGRRPWCTRSWPPASGSSLSTSPAEPAPVVDRAGVPLLAATPVVLDPAGPPAGRRPARRHRRTGRSALADRAVDHRADDHRWCGAHPGRPRLHRRGAPRDGLPGVKNAIHELPGVRFTTSERLLAPGRGLRAPGAAGGADRHSRRSSTAIAGLVGRHGRRRGQHGRHAGRGGAEAGQHRRRSRWTGRCRPPPKTPSNRFSSRRCWWPSNRRRGMCWPSRRTVPPTRRGRSRSPAGFRRAPPSRS